MAWVGITSTWWELHMPVWWALAPRTTMPSGRRSTTRMNISGSSCLWGGRERSPLGSVMAPSTVRSLSWTMVRNFLKFS